MSSFKKAAKSGMRFQIESNPKDLYNLINHSNDNYDLMNGSFYVGTAYFTYKHLVIEISYLGIKFKKEVRLGDLNFMP